MPGDASRSNGKKGGRPKGTKLAKTIAKETAREALRIYLTEQMTPVADALLSRARGVRYFVTRNKKTGKYELVTNPEQVVSALNQEDEQTGEFYTDKPDVQAIREIFDRTVDRPQEPERAVAVTGTLTLEALIVASSETLDET